MRGNAQVKIKKKGNEITYSLRKIIFIGDEIFYILKMYVMLKK